MTHHDPDSPQRDAAPSGSRRSFLAGAATVTALGVTGGSALLGSATTSFAAELNGLEGKIKGTVVTRGEPTFEAWRQSMIWQTQKIPRRPEMIVQAESVEDVVAAVRYAKATGGRITARTGGHSFSACFLRDDGILVDVSRLQTIEIDAAKGEAIVGPGVFGRRLNAALEPHGLAFPTAHCGMVPVSGFLLGGGLGWNGNAWGAMSTYNILEVQIVTPDGELRTASETENPDLFWAVRGGGPGLFGIVTSFRLRCHPLPQAIRSDAYIFPFTSLVAVAKAMEAIGPALASNVELLAVVLKAPPGMEGKCAEAGCDQILILQGIAFADGAAAAQDLLRPLSQHPIVRGAFASMLDQPQTFETLYIANEQPFPQQRCAVDNIYADDLGPVAEVIARHMPRSPSRENAPLLLYKGNPALPEGACGTKGSFYISCTTQWKDAAADEANKAWLKAMYDELHPLGTGSYINEFDQERQTPRLQRCYTEQGWTKLAALRRKWDPDRLFQTFMGLEPSPRDTRS